MNIITAEEARKITNDYIPYEIENTVKYVMGLIENEASNGNNEIDFRDDLIPCVYFGTIKSNKFKKYIESLGYKYSFDSKEEWGFYSEWVTISW